MNLATEEPVVTWGEHVSVLLKNRIKINLVDVILKIK